MNFEPLGPLQGPKGVFGGPLGGLNNKKSWKIPDGTYQIKAFDSLSKIIMKKMSFEALGPLQGPKGVFVGPLGGDSIVQSHEKYLV